MNIVPRSIFVVCYLVEQVYSAWTFGLDNPNYETITQKSGKILPLQKKTRVTLEEPRCVLLKFVHVTVNNMISTPAVTFDSETLTVNITYDFLASSASSYEVIGKGIISRNCNQGNRVRIFQKGNMKSTKKKNMEVDNDYQYNGYERGNGQTGSGGHAAGNILRGSGGHSGEGYHKKGRGYSGGGEYTGSGNHGGGSSHAGYDGHEGAGLHSGSNGYAGGINYGGNTGDKESSGFKGSGSYRKIGGYLDDDGYTENGNHGGNESGHGRGDKHMGSDNYQDNDIYSDGDSIEDNIDEYYDIDEWHGSNYYDSGTGGIYINEGAHGSAIYSPNMIDFGDYGWDSYEFFAERKGNKKALPRGKYRADRNDHPSKHRGGNGSRAAFDTSLLRHNYGGGQGFGGGSGYGGSSGYGSSGSGGGDDSNSGSKRWWMSWDY